MPFLLISIHLKLSCCALAGRRFSSQWRLHMLWILVCITIKKHHYGWIRFFVIYWPSALFYDLIWFLIMYVVEYYLWCLRIQIDSHTILVTRYKLYILLCSLLNLCPFHFNIVPLAILSSLKIFFWIGNENHIVCIGHSLGQHW